MALQIWLPLNGSLENKGVHNIQPIYKGGMSASNITSEGKVTNISYNWPSNGNGYAISLPNFMNTFKSYKNYTISAWVKFTESAQGHSSTICSTGNWNDGIKQLCFALYGYNNGYTGLLIPNLNKWSDSINFKSTLIPNQWYHVAVTYNGTVTKAYVNGVLQGTYNGGGITSSSENADLYIGSATYYGGFTIRGNINDFRIYDHCLSGKEVSLVAQGLVAHYLLNNEYDAMPTLLGGNLDFSASSNTGIVHPGMGPEGLDIIEQSHTKTSGYTEIVSWGGHSVSVNEVYTASFYARSNNPGTLQVYFYNNASGVVQSLQAVSSLGNTSTGSDGGINLALTTEWKKYWITWTFRSSGTTVNKTLLFRLLANNTHVQVAGVKLEKGNKATAWLPKDFTSTTEYDCSGYGHHGTQVGNLDFTSNAPRYNIATVFDGSTANIESYQDSTGWTDATISAWINPATHAVSDGQDRSCIFIGGFYITLTADGKIATYCYGKNNPGYHTGSTTIPLNQWTHVVAVWNESTKEHSVYINGKKEYTISNCYGAGNTDWHKRKYIGRERWWAENNDNQYHRFFTGAISDVRLYATPLSETDIIELYNTPIAIGNTGAIMAHMFKEV